MVSLEVGLFFTGGEITLPVASWEVVPLKMVVVDGGVGLFFTGGEMMMSVASLMMVGVGGISVSLLVVLLGGLEVSLVVKVVEGAWRGR